MTENLPEPLTPADCDLRSFVYMPVDIIRLFSSEFHAKATDSEWRAGFTLWLKSYHQVPAASVPDDDVILARMAELGRDVEAWKAIRPMALHGWVKCSDGRLYHPTVAEKACEAWTVKVRKREGAAHTNAVKKQKGSAAQSATVSATHTVSHSVADSVTLKDTLKAADSATLSARNEMRGDETKRDEQLRAREGFQVDGSDPALLIIGAFDQARVDAFGPERRRPFPHATDIVHARRWHAAGYQPQDLYQFFRGRQQARAKAGKDPIDSLAFLEQAVAELGAVAPAPASGVHAPGVLRFLSPEAEIAARKAWWKRDHDRNGPDWKCDLKDYGLRVDKQTQTIVLTPAPRPEIPALEATG